jgi:hypothetical protein
LMLVRLMLVCLMFVCLMFVRLLFVRLLFVHFAQKGSYHPTMPPKATVCVRICVVFLKLCYKMFVETFCVPCGVVLFILCGMCRKICRGSVFCGCFLKTLNPKTLKP